MTEPDWLTITNAAAHFQVSPRTIRNWIKHHLLRAHRYGRMYRIERLELRRFEEQHFHATDVAPDDAHTAAGPATAPGKSARR